MDVAGGAGSTLVPGFVSASEGDDEPDRGFSSVSSSTNEGEGSLGEADMVERREADSGIAGA